MKKNRLLHLLLGLIVLLFSCHNKKTENSTDETVELNEKNVQLFAKQIESSVNNCAPDFYNNAFDKNYIKSKISKNSIVYSSLDTDFGKEFFERSLKIGNFSVAAVENGGDFKFIRYYFLNGEHHLVFRTYQDYGIKIDDYTVDTVDGKLKIKDGFIYNVSSTFSNQVCSNILFDVMKKTNPDGAVSILEKVSDLLAVEKANEARQLLEKNRELLKEYPYYWHYYIQSLYQSDRNNFIRELEKLKEEGFDARSILLHKLLYYSNSGKVTETEQTINSLIPFSGDDPVYLLFYGKANYYAGKYEDALVCYEEAVKAMPLIWDLWYGKLECYAKMKDKSNFETTLNQAEKIYNMNIQEIDNFAKKQFPEMRK